MTINTIYSIQFHRSLSFTVLPALANNCFDTVAPNRAAFFILRVVDSIFQQSGYTNVEIRLKDVSEEVKDKVNANLLIAYS